MLAAMDSMVIILLLEVLDSMLSMESNVTMETNLAAEDVLSKKIGHALKTLGKFLFVLRTLSFKHVVMDSTSL